MIQIQFRNFFYFLVKRISLIIAVSRALSKTLIDRNLVLLQREPVRLGNRQWGCPYCPKIMEKAVYIRRHLLVHTGEKPFSCSICNASYSQKSTLNAHYRSKHFDSVYGE